MRRKKAFTLLETLVAFSLFSLLLTSLFFWYRHTHTDKSALDKMKGPVREERYCEQKLQKILPQTQEGPFFIDDDGALVFTFDRGPHFDPLLSNTVLAKLYHSKKSQRLMLAIWPLEEEGEAEMLPLLDNVNEISFDFYMPPPIEKKVVDPKEVGKARPTTGWQSIWRKEYGVLPAMMKVTIKRDKKFTLAFELVHAPYAHVYLKSGSRLS